MNQKEKKKYFIIAIVILTIFAAVFSAWFLTGGFMEYTTGQIADEDYRAGHKKFYRREQYVPFERGSLSQIPDIDENMGLDLRGCDASGLDFTAKSDLLKQVTFDSATVWPDPLPEDFSPEEIAEIGKNPGLGIRALHEKGITGEGVSIAIVDQALNPEHAEYADRLMNYELLHCGDTGAQMHGSAVTSLAVGKNCGVAPGANVYYIASTFGTYGPGGMKMNLKYMAQSIDRILEINELLPEEKRIRVISISRGFSMEKGADETAAAIERARKAGVFVITTSMERNYGFALMGLGRARRADPDDFASYGPGNFWSSYFYEGELGEPRHTLLVPMDGRTYASWYTTEGYEYASSGGLSWSVPWLAGMYALCVQADPNLTADEFIEKAFETGTVQTVEYQGEEYELGTIINPEALVGAIQKKEESE